jgi:hypothetical protein
MKNLNINIYPDLVFYPVVNFDYKTGICEISGESFMEDTYKFYEPIIEWLNEYIKEKKPIVLNIKLTYFNTSSSKFILVILNTLKKYKNDSNNATVNWFYNKEDIDMLKEITEFQDETGLEINKVIL